VPNTYVYESALAPISVLNTKSQSDIIQWEIVGFITGAIVLVIPIDNAKTFTVFC
jgi:hypothetical protein